MNVFRIVHPATGQGPYMSQFKPTVKDADGYMFDLTKVCNAYGKNSPEPMDDELLLSNYRAKYPNTFHMPCNAFFFGFSTMSQAFKWFGSSGICKMLHWYGFELVIKEVSDDAVLNGDSQCMVIKENWEQATNVRKMSAEEVEDYARELRRK